MDYHLKSVFADLPIDASVAVMFPTYCATNPKIVNPLSE